MHDILIILGTALITYASTQFSGGIHGVTINPRTARQLAQRLENLNMALPDILNVVTDLEAGVAGLDAEVRALIAAGTPAPGSISAADADALQARLESLKAAVAAIPAMP